MWPILSQHQSNKSRRSNEVYFGHLYRPHAAGAAAPVFRKACDLRRRSISLTVTVRSNVVWFDTSVEAAGAAVAHAAGPTAPVWQGEQGIRAASV